MIRRGFWLAVGAATGIYGYRRVTSAASRLSANLKTTESGTVDGARRTAIRAARESYRFTRDVREGMDLYMARQSGPPDPTLDTRNLDTRNLDTANRETAHRDTASRDTNDPRPKDGH
jgi:hypothetical protein